MSGFEASVRRHDGCMDSPTRDISPLPPPAVRSDHTLLAEALFHHRPRPWALQRVAMLLQRYHDLPGLVHAAATGADDPALRPLAAALALEQRALEHRCQRGEGLTSPEKAAQYLATVLRHRRREVFVAMFLDNRHRVICCDSLFSGGIDGAQVFPGVVARKALSYNAAAVIVAHNHPSGVSEPSQADQRITRRLQDALALVDIRLLDHFIIGDGAPESLARRGCLSQPG